MGRRKTPRGRSVNGILLLDKPLGITSNDALQRVKRVYHAQKAGHTGSLDPLAGGLLPVCFGSATKLSTYLLDADKRYLVRVRLGVTTTTGDAEGEVQHTRRVDQVTQQAVLDLLPRFTGRIQQLPPMYSALKHQGKRLYELARQGIEVEREPREITIYSLQLVDFALPEFELDVVCSKGTYVRTLAEDMGEALGCGAHVIGLRRTGVGPYGENAMVGMAALQTAAETRHRPIANGGRAGQRRAGRAAAAARYRAGALAGRAPVRRCRLLSEERTTGAGAQGAHAGLGETLRSRA